MTAGEKKRSPVLQAGFRWAARFGQLADSGIAGEDEIAGAQRGFLEIRRVGGKHLPAGHLLAEHLNGSHVRKLAAETLVVLFGGAEPHPVVRIRSGLIAQDEDDLVPDVDREAAEHRVSPWRHRSERVEHELMRDVLARLGGEGGVRRGGGLVAAGWHGIQDSGD